MQSKTGGGGGLGTRLGVLWLTHSTVCYRCIHPRRKSKSLYKSELDVDNPVYDEAGVGLLNPHEVHMGCGLIVNSSSLHIVSFTIKTMATPVHNKRKLKEKKAPQVERKNIYSS